MVRGAREAVARPAFPRRGRGEPRAAGIAFMLAERRERPFSRAGWLFELKYDGFRMLAAVEDGRACLFYRGGSEATGAFPEVARDLARIPAREAVLDGELAVVDATGRPQFQRLQQRFQLERPSERALAAGEHPACYFAFDLLRLDGQDLRSRPLRERKELLRRLIPAQGRVRYVEHVEDDGERLYEQVRARGLEGMVGKRADSPYQGGRSAHWVKVTADRTAEFVVVGITRGRLGEEGALHLGAYAGRRLVYVGSVGSGFTAGTLDQARRLLAPSALDRPACSGVLPRAGLVAWVRPAVVCEVRYKAWTAEGLLRQPVFKRFRPELRPQSCRRPD